MKKLLLSIGVLASFSLSAQTDTAFSANQFANAQMTVLNRDLDTFNWFIQDFTGAGTMFDAQGEFLASESYNNATGTALTPDNWAITPAINLSTFSTASLKFTRFAVDSNYRAEHYSVYAVTALDSASLANPTALFTETIATAGLGTQTVDLNAFAGQASVFIAFRHYGCTDMFILGIDDILVSGIENPASLTEEQLGASVYPNPTTGILNFKLNSNAVSFDILTMDGKIVASSTMNATTGSIDISGLQTGMYMYEITTENGAKATSTFVKK